MEEMETPVANQLGEKSKIMYAASDHSFMLTAYIGPCQKAGIQTHYVPYGRVFE